MGNGLSTNRRRKPVPRVAVLGGGPSGLTAAYTLLRVHPEVHVDVYEADGRFGGAVKSEAGGGFVYDLGPNSMNAKHAVVHHLLHKELGLTGRITPRASSSSRRFLVLKDGVLTPVPLTPAQMLRSNLLPWQAKLRLCAEPFVPSGRKGGKQGKKQATAMSSRGSGKGGGMTGADRMGKTEQMVEIEGRTEVESVGQFFSRRFGKHFTDWLVDPAVGGIYSADPYNISMKHAFRKVWHVEQKYGSVLGGLLRGGFKSSQPPNTASVLPASSTGNGGKRAKQTQQGQGEQQNSQQTVVAKQTNKSVTAAQPTRAQLMQSFNYDDGMHVLTDTLVERIKEFGPRAKLISSCAVHTIDSTSPSSYSSSSSSSPSPKRQPKTPITYQPGHWRINGRRRRYDAVITTIPAHALKDVTSNVRSLRRGFRKLSHQIPYAPVSVAVLGFDKAQMSAVPADAHGFGALVPSCEKSTAPSGMLGVNFTSDGFPSRLIDDDGKNNKTFWTVYLGGSRRPAIVTMPPSVIVDLAVGQLQQTLGVKGQPAYARVENWANAIPTYHTKFDEALCTMARIERRTKGSVALAGNYRDGVGVPDALLSGVQHALKINHFLRNSVK